MVQKLTSFVLENFTATFKGILFTAVSKVCTFKLLLLFFFWGGLFRVRKDEIVEIVGSIVLPGAFWTVLASEMSIASWGANPN